MAALSVMALTAVSAQAAVHFNVKTAELKTTKPVLGKTSNAALKWMLTALGVATECTTVVANSATIEGAGHNKGSLTFSGCTTNNPQCKVEEPIVAEVLSQLITHATDKKIYVLFSQQEGKSSFTSLTFLDAIEVGGCPLPVNTPLPVTGSTVASIDKANATEYEKEQLTHKVTFSAALEALFPSDKLKLGTNAATFMGEGDLFLCSDENWSAKP